MSQEAINNNAAFIWSIAEILRGDFKRSEYQKVILPLTVLRRLDAFLAPKKAEFLKKAEKALSIIVREMNDKHGTELTDEHKLTLKQYESAFVSNPDVVQAATANNDFEAFKKVAFSPVFLDTIINQMDANEEIFKLILAEDRMRELFTEFLARSVYDQVREG